MFGVSIGVKVNIFCLIVNIALLGSNVLFSVVLLGESVPILMDVLVGSVGTFPGTLDWFFLYMVRNPVAQTRCQEQIDLVSEIVIEDTLITFTSYGDLSKRASPSTVK